MTDLRPVNDLVERGREAAARGSWREAYDLRIGVHTAEAIRVGRGYRGKGVHAAARIAAVAAGNEVVATRDEAEAAGLRYTNPRTLELKGLSAPVEVVTIDWA